MLTKYHDDQADEMWMYPDKCHICGKPLDEKGECKDKDDEVHQNAS
jgi:hypothetical protein